MTDDTTPKVLETHPVSKKYPLPIMIVMVVVLVIIIGIGMYKKTPPNSDSAVGIIPEKQEQVWELCWSEIGVNRHKGRCGRVKKTVFNDSDEIKEMTVLYPAGVTTEFYLPEGTIIGEWSQSSGNGWWYLEKRAPGHYVGECQGYDRGDKLRNLVLRKK